MKKIILILTLILALVGISLGQTVNTCTVPSPTCTSFVNSDNKAIYQAIMSTYSVAGTGSTTVTGGTVYASYFGDKIGNTITTSVAPDYVSGDNVGGINTIVNVVRANQAIAILNDIVIWEKNNQKPELTIDYWDASPSGTYTDNAPEVIAGDQSKWLGSVRILTGDYITQGTISRASLTNLGLLLETTGGARDIYFTIAVHSTYTSGGTTGIVLKHSFLQN